MNNSSVGLDFCSCSSSHWPAVAEENKIEEAARSLYITFSASYSLHLLCHRQQARHMEFFHGPIHGVADREAVAKLVWTRRQRQPKALHHNHGGSQIR